MKQILGAILLCLPLMATAGKVMLVPPKPVGDAATALIGVDIQVPSHHFASPASSCVGDVTFSLTSGMQPGGEGGEFAQTYADCHGYAVLLLSKILEKNATDAITRVRVVDAVPLPVFGATATLKARKGQRLKWISSSDGFCLVDGKTTTFSFDALVTWDSHKRADGRKGQIKQAYGYDIVQQRILPIDVKRLTCEYEDI